MLDRITQDIVGEALDNMEQTYTAWIKALVSTEAEKELAALKIKQVEHARGQLTKLMESRP